MILKDSSLTIEDGKIASISRDTGAAQTKPDLGSPGHVIIPGLINADTFVEAGLGFEFERDHPVMPNLRAEDGIDILREFHAGPAIVGTGVTTIYIGPGFWREVSGQGVILQLDGETLLDMKMSGTNFVYFSVSDAPLLSFGRGKSMPSTHMGAFGMIRDRFVAARAYLDQKKASLNGAAVSAPDYDPDLETLADVLSGKRTARIDCDTAQEITQAIALADEFGFRPVLEHVTEAYKVKEFLAAKKFPLIMMPYTQGDVFDLEEERQILTAPTWLIRHGVPVAFETYGHGRPPYGNLHEYSDPRSLFLDAILPIRYGMSSEEALTALTKTAADILGILDRVGTLETGKSANFAVLDGPPFEYTTHIVQVWIHGKKVFDRDSDSVFYR